jgi:hypothetical protein
MPLMKKKWLIRGQFWNVIGMKKKRLSSICEIFDAGKEPRLCVFSRDNFAGLL